MAFIMSEVIEVLERTPRVLEQYLVGLSDGLLQSNEGEGTWNPSQVIGHLIDGEKYNWIPRLELILSNSSEKKFPVFDRFSHLQQYHDWSIEEKIREFASLRGDSIEKLKLLINDNSQLEMTGIHPEYGEVKALELISTWAVHDLTHISQITRVLAKRYDEAVGPWKSYLGILQS
ncbi:DinB family protein [Bacillus sp. ISL-35]|uniref:DinB family protein n=1 Tax=Bacillus sp. ISL-35 TaxID=2819122 RepID=UPI001BEA27FE|nr:DinB family protein [Bacillus sp. ISL-35]MBT2679387.1 DinB family protein [Bacillus sp. ISL-35]MBT2703288.1 DinB family protein [Chryseobacterium sp. ISL-80]